MLAGFSIEVHGGRRNTGVITLNNATHVVVRDVHLSASADSDRAIWYDGISTSRGTSGLLERVTVDGMVKVGIYIARGSHDVVVRDCEASHSGIGAGHPFPGMSTSGASGVTFERCHSRDNTGEGLLIAADGAVGDLPPLASSDVTVRGGSFDHNGHEDAVRTDSLGGIAIGSGWQNPEAIPRRIRLEGVRSVRNSSHGIRIESGEDIGVIDADVGENGAQGISIDGWSPAYPFVIRVSNVEIARTAIYNNGLCWATREVAAVGVRLARGIRVHDATISDRLTGREAACLSGEPAGTRQGRAIDLVAEPPDVVVRDVTVVGSSPGKLETDARGGLRVAP